MLSEQEYEHLQNMLNYNLSTRNNLLTFSFTTVLTILGLAIGIEDATFNNVSVILYIVPLCILIPFTARIVYYRILYAHIESFLMSYAPEKMQFRINSQKVPEENIKHYKIIAFLNNFETSILAVICMIVFYIKYCPGINGFDIIDACLLSVPVFLTAIIIAITLQGFNYKKHVKDYGKAWKSLLDSQAQNKADKQNRKI